VATGDNKYFQTLYGRRGKRYSGLNPLVPDYALEAGATVFDDWMLDVAPATGNTATIEAYTDDTVGSFTANVETNATITGFSDDTTGAFVAGGDSVNATINGFTDDTTGAFTANTATNATISASTDDTRGAFSANVATNGTIQGFLDDTTGAFTAEVVSSGTNATIDSFTDDTIGSFFATVTGDVLPTNGGAVIHNLRRHTERYKRRMEAEERARQEGVDRQLRKIVADTPKPSKAIKEAYKAIRLAQSDLDNAEQRLMAYLVMHEQEMKDEMAIIKIIAELL
jgi:hypothetical protein